MYDSNRTTVTTCKLEATTVSNETAKSANCSASSAVFTSKCTVSSWKTNSDRAANVATKLNSRSVFDLSVDSIEGNSSSEATKSASNAVFSSKCIKCAVTACKTKYNSNRTAIRAFKLKSSAVFNVSVDSNKANSASENTKPASSPVCSSKLPVAPWTTKHNSDRTSNAISKLNSSAIYDLPVHSNEANTSNEATRSAFSPVFSSKSAVISRSTKYHSNRTAVRASKLESSTVYNLPVDSYKANNSNKGRKPVH